MPGTRDSAMTKTNLAMILSLYILLLKKKSVTLQRKLTVFLSSSEALVKPGSVAQVL